MLSADGKTLYGGTAGNPSAVYALSTADGTAKWRCSTGKSFVSTPRLSADGATLFAGGQYGGGGLFAVGAADGQIKWRQTAGGDVRLGPEGVELSGDGATVYAGAEDGAVDNALLFLWAVVLAP